MAEGKVSKLKQDLAAAGEERRELLVGKDLCACAGTPCDTQAQHNRMHAMSAYS